MTDVANQSKPEEQIEVFNQQTDDATTGDHSIAAPPASVQHHPEPQPEPKSVSIADGGRAALAEKFKAMRQDKEPAVPASGDYTDPAQTYGQVAAPEPVTAPSAAPTVAEPRRMKVKVRGEERELTEDELLAAAQKGLAGDSYVEEARQLLETAKQRVQVSRQHPDASLPAPSATEQDDPQDGQHPADPIEEIVEQIQYGDPKAAAQKLRTTMAEVADSAVQKATVSTRVREDIAADLRAHDDFVKKHADIASDPIAASVIRDGLLNGYREDLRKIGVPEEMIPNDPTQLANHHRQYKLQGQPVRQVATLLDNAAQRFNEWRGTARQEPNPQPQPQPRVDVQLNRDARRMAIPHQPTRATVQPSTTQPQAQGVNPRKAAVEAAQRARGQV